MRKTTIALAFAASALIGALAAPRAQAQSYPAVKGLTPFSAEANYMSLPGYLRYRYFVTAQKWISYEEAARIVAEQ